MVSRVDCDFQADTKIDAEADGTGGVPALQQTGATPHATFHTAVPRSCALYQCASVFLLLLCAAIVATCIVGYITATGGDGGGHRTSLPLENLGNVPSFDTGFRPPDMCQANTLQASMLWGHRAPSSFTETYALSCCPPTGVGGLQLPRVIREGCCYPFDCAQRGGQSKIKLKKNRPAEEQPMTSQ